MPNAYFDRAPQYHFNASGQQVRCPVCVGKDWAMCHVCGFASDTFLAECEASDKADIAWALKHHNIASLTSALIGYTRTRMQSNYTTS